MDLFGDHFHPIIAIAAPFYRIYPHPSTLLVVQAAALALSVLIVTKAVQELFGPRLGRRDRIRVRDFVGAAERAVFRIPRSESRGADYRRLQRLIACAASGKPSGCRAFCCW